MAGKILLSLIFFIIGYVRSQEYMFIKEPSTFKVHRQAQIITQKNHIKVQIKTIDATGLIFFAKSADNQDFLTLEMVRGKARMGAYFGRGPANKLRPIGGYYDLWQGKDIADNEWHTIEVIRNIRETIMFVDREKGKLKKEIFMKSPPTYNRLSVDLVTFGGYWSFAPNEITEENSQARKGISGCFRQAMFSQYWPMENGPANSALDFMKTSGFQLVGKQPLSYCEDSIPPYSPLFFPSSAVHIALVDRLNWPSLKVSMMFRTVIAEQTLANFTHWKKKNKVNFGLDRKGRVALTIDLGANTQVIETSKEDYHDSLWHDVSFDVNNKKDTNGDYQVKFTVDGKTRYSIISDEFIFDGNLNVGFGFTGCMRNVMVNNKKIYEYESKKVNKDTGEETVTPGFANVGVMEGCSLKDYCTPNPCQNGGRCNQTEDNIVCDCRNTLYEASTCNRARFNYTCAGVRESGQRRSDVYYIDFDGMGPMEPVKALCDLGRTVESTTTQLNNTNFVDLDVTTESGINNVDINYVADIIQMRELITNSMYCEQAIKFACKGTPLFRSPSGPTAVDWMGGDDILHYYWGGAQGRRGYCKCGIEGNCKKKDEYCNCDSLESYENTFDEGNFTIKEHLPVRRVHFTSVLKQDGRAGNNEAILRLGHLRCTGFGSRAIAATFRKPWSFLAVDHPDQPFDNIYAGELQFDFKTSMAYNYMVLMAAHGPFSGDYIKVMIWSKTLIRVHLNMGDGDFKQDLDISETGRTLDDNQWHEFNVAFNLKELNVTVDGVRAIQGLPLQEHPVQFNVDDKAVYVGGSYHDKNGFVGCIRALYVNGRIHNIRKVAEGQEDYGVYPGCGAACAILNRPCNYGTCIDEYDSFKCNCTTSPNSGKYCQNETNAMRFTSSSSIEYTIKDLDENIATGMFVVGFKTKEKNQVLAQLLGNDYRHLTLLLEDGYPTLHFSFQETSKTEFEKVITTEETSISIKKRRLNNNAMNVIKVHFSHMEVFLEVTNYEYLVGANVTERLIDPDDRSKGKVLDAFGKVKSFSVGKATSDVRLNGRKIPSNNFVGCMSGAKLVLHPMLTSKKRFRESKDYDIFSLFLDKDKLKDKDGNKVISGNAIKIKEGDTCGPELPIPGKLPTVGPPRQFFTMSPGLDKSVRVTIMDTANRVIVMVVIVAIAVILLGFLFLIYKYVNNSNKSYRRLEKAQKPYDVNGQADNPAML